MGNGVETQMVQGLKHEKMLQCPSCSNPYDLDTRIPKMICSNQHNLCDQCLNQLRPKTCPSCRQLLWIKKSKNLLLVYLLERISGINSDKGHTPSSPFLKAENKSGSPDRQSFNTTESPSKRTIKMKTVKQQSIPNLNLELYKQEREFRKKYSVANIFTVAREQETKQVHREQTFEEAVAKAVDEFHIAPFREMLELKKDPQGLLSLELSLYKIPKIFDFMSRFSSLERLNLNKNRILKIQNLETLKSLAYLSLSDNQIEEIENLSSLGNLKNLYLNRNRIERISNISGLVNLQFLGLSYNCIKRIEGLDTLSELRWLNLQFNQISKIEGIMNLKKLEIILLGTNQIMVFEGFQNCPALQEIHIDNNKIIDLKRALSMKHLRRLKLEDNPGLKEDNSKDYLKFMEIIEAKSKGIEKEDSGCDIY